MNKNNVIQNAIDKVLKEMEMDDHNIEHKILTDTSKFITDTSLTDDQLENGVYKLEKGIGYVLKMKFYDHNVILGDDVENTDIKFFLDRSPLIKLTEQFVIDDVFLSQFHCQIVEVEEDGDEDEFLFKCRCSEEELIEKLKIGFNDSVMVKNFDKSNNDMIKYFTSSVELIDLGIYTDITVH